MFSAVAGVHLHVYNQLESPVTVRERMHFQKTRVLVAGPLAARLSASFVCHVPIDTTYLKLGS